MNLPRISVVTPSLNQARYIERTIRSVLDQGYPNLEYFIYDGGSTDGSVEIISRYAERLDYWVSEPDGGQSAAINAGWDRATGEILAWLGSDDYYLPETLQTVGEHFRDHPGTLLLYGTCERVDQDGAYIGYVGSRYRRGDMLFSRQVIPQPSSFLRRSLVNKIGSLDASLRYSMDYDLFLRAAKVTAPVFMDRHLSGATIHPGAKTTVDRGPAKVETHRLRLQHASGLGRLFVRLQPLQSRLFHLLPAQLRGPINHLRPRRVFGAPPEQRTRRN